MASDAYDSMREFRKEIGLPYSHGYMHRLVNGDARLSTEELAGLSEELLRGVFHAGKKRVTANRRRLQTPSG